MCYTKILLKISDWQIDCVEMSCLLTHAQTQVNNGEHMKASCLQVLHLYQARLVFLQTSFIKLVERSSGNDQAVLIPISIQSGGVFWGLQHPQSTAMFLWATHRYPCEHPKSLLKNKRAPKSRLSTPTKGILKNCPKKTSKKDVKGPKWTPAVPCLVFPFGPHSQPSCGPSQPESPKSPSSNSRFSSKRRSSAARNIPSVWSFRYT